MAEIRVVVCKDGQVEVTIKCQPDWIKRYTLTSLIDSILKQAIPEHTEQS